MFKRITIVLVSLLLLVGLSALIFDAWLHQTPNESVGVAENALATKNLMVIAHVNHQRIMTLLALSDSDSPAVLDVPIIDADVLMELYQGAANFTDNMSQIVLGVESNAKQKTSQMGLITSGYFESSIILSSLEKQFNITRIDSLNFHLAAKDGLSKVTEIEFVCPDNAIKSSPLSSGLWLHVSPSWIILTTDKAYSALLYKRMSNHAKAEIDLTDWREFRHGQLASVGLLVPKLSANLNGMTGLMMSGVTQKNKAVKQVFLGAQASYQPKGLSFSVLLNTRSAKWVKKHLELVEQSLLSFQQGAIKLSPTLASLVNNVEIKGENKQLSIQVAFPADGLAKISTVIEEGLTSMFSMGGVSSASNVVEKESVNESPWDFSNNQTLKVLPLYSKGQFEAEPLWKKDSLAMDIERIQLGKESGLLELGVKASLMLKRVTGNWWDSKATLSLLVDSVKDEQGKELLRDERCLNNLPKFAKKNQLAIAQPIQDIQGKTHITKTLRMIEGVDLSSVAKISGKVIIHAPMDIQIVKVAYEKGVSVDALGMQFDVKAIKMGSVSYRLSGDVDKFVSIRAFNKDDKVLSHSSSFTSKVDGSVSFKGKIARLEVMVAGEQWQQDIDFDFLVDDLMRQQSTSNRTGIDFNPQALSMKKWRKLEKLSLKTFNPKKVTALSKTAKQIMSWNSGPFMLRVAHDAKSNWDSSVKMQLYMPLLPELAGNLGAVTLKLRSQKKRKKGKKRVWYTEPLFIHPSYRENKQGKKIFTTSVKMKNTNMLLIQKSMDIDAKKKKKIKTLKGQVIMRIPEHLTVKRQPFPDFSTGIDVMGIGVQLQEISRGQIPRIKLKVDGDLTKFVSLVATTDKGKKVYPAQTDYRQDHWLIQFDLRDDLTNIELTYADKLTERVYSFKKKVKY